MIYIHTSETDYAAIQNDCGYVCVCGFKAQAGEARGMSIFILKMVSRTISDGRVPREHDLSDGKAISYTVGFRQSKTVLFDWNLLVLLLIVSRVDFIAFVLFLEAAGVREYCCIRWQSKIGWNLCFSRVLGEKRVFCARRTLVQADWWRWT